MHDFPFLAAISGTQNLPPPFDETQAGERYAEWTARIQKHSDAAFATLNDNPTSNALLACLFGTTPFLTRLLLRHPEHYLQIAKDGPDKVMQQIATLLRNTPSPGIDADSLGKTLRELRAQAALTIAIADISGHWTLQQVTRALSDFAQQILQCAIDGLLLIAGAAGEIELTDPKNPSDHCGYVLLGMGKLGAGELNYSSDVDLIALYDPDRCAYSGKRSLRDFQIRFTQKLVKLLQDFTEDGYVFRTDLRLRPDPAATPVALPIEAAETYYESVGKGWERAAMIKARPIAGDIAVGQAFLQHIRPFIWRKSLDFAAIHDVNNMIGLIHSHHGHDAIRIAGHNVKLGIGGIREIEFLVQTHQLIAGGRERQLQTPGTLALLDVLERLGRLPAEARAGLAEAYIFLRTVEHRLQMLNDEQTHSLPEDADGLARIAAFMGMPEGDRFEATLRRHLDFVARQFRSLMATGLVQPSDEGDTRIPLGTEVPTAETLRDFHFAEPEQALEILARWRAYRYRAFQTRRAQALLDHLTPQILKALGATADPDGALRRVDNFLALLPAGIQVLSLFNANPWLLETLAEIMGTAPTLAETLARNPLLLDAMLSRDFMQEFPQKPALAADLARALEPAADLEEVLNLSRRWANDRKFQVGVQLLCGLIDGEDTGAALSDIADTLLTAMLPRVSTDFAQKHGTVPDGGMAVVAMGKLGGCELTFTSDLDLVFIYTGSEPSDGPKSLTAGHYFARLAQRYINALTALTEEGQLYEIDMRLRPSG
ncbi:MAG TPA: glutamine-synthetase adenylyltransferase, partial [Alphaproteobacteria bacterium]|nr:glutamine-synthetase adenylyltransferase [Alphaproteobacteria bacterium]